jgi:hypothetical protein
MANGDVDQMGEREMDALTWHEFFIRPGDYQMDADGYWSARMGVRMVFPHYATDVAALRKIEAELKRRGLRDAYIGRLRALVGAGQTTAVAVNPLEEETSTDRSSATLAQRRLAALAALSH